MNDVLERVKRGIRKPPKVIVKRILQEIKNQLDRYYAPKRAQQFDLKELLRKTETRSLEQLWQQLSQQPYLAQTTSINPSDLESFCPDEKNKIVQKAEQALRHEVDLLGSGLLCLGEQIDWHKDYKTHISWPKKYIKDINYNNPEWPSDVKFPWEVSRLQWLIPVGQAYLLTQDERYAQAVKKIVQSWIIENPYAMSVNWACTMEVALRILSWTWFFHVFKKSSGWQDTSFQSLFLTSLYLHAEFTETHLEFSDINGNHYTADAAGLVFSGLFFGPCATAKRWHDKGWAILCSEMPRQVFKDGVDFEASIPYHRLVLELFFLPALYRQIQGYSLPFEYLKRLESMAVFSSAYLSPNDTAPLWGDADDARALPFGYQDINNHSYLCNWIGLQYHRFDLLINKKEALAEVFWLFGAKGCETVQKNAQLSIPTSCAFSEGGFYIMRNHLDHIFIDCGPLGLAGRGGHGHNDCLSFEATLNGVKLISDCGAYLYTASYQERNLFRSTQSHNTPCIDEQELNRFIRWDYLWNMHNDAHPIVESWKTSIDEDLFCGTHTGYQRLDDPVTPKRTIHLQHSTHKLTITDTILCNKDHQVHIPLHFSPEVQLLAENDKQQINIQAQGKQFILRWSSDDFWNISFEQTRISPSYGKIELAQKLVWSAQIEKEASLIVSIEPYN